MMPSTPEHIDVTCMKLDEAASLLESENVKYKISKTSPPRPLRHHFAVDDSCLYVVRQSFAEDGLCLLTVAAKQVKLLSDNAKGGGEHGLQNR
jgi:hypothetical protein